MKATLQHQQAVIEVIGRLQSEFLGHGQRGATWNRLLDDILRMTASAFGLLGVVNTTPMGKHILKPFLLNDIHWDSDRRQLFNAEAADGFEISNLNNLFGAVLSTGQVVLSHDTATDPRCGTLPPGTPPIHNFLGLPIHHDGELVAMVGVANRADGYNQRVADSLEPLLRSIGQLVVAARSAEALLAEQQRLAYVLAATGEGIWDYDVPSGRISHNTQWCILVGCPQRQSSHASDYIANRIHPEDQARALAVLSQSLKAGDVFQTEYRLLRPEGHYIWLLDRGRVVERDAQGQALRMVGSIQDITQRKTSEAHLELSSRIFMQAREGIMVTDTKARIIDVNDTFCAITGYPRDEVLGKNASLLSSGRHDTDFFERLWCALETTGYWSGEIWDRRKNGELYPSSLTINLLAGAQGQEKRYVGIFTDISVQKEHERQLASVAHFDQLTGLSNRVLMTERLKMAMLTATNSGQPLAVAFIDLDGFKSINDQHGNDLGNQVLITVSARLRRLLRCDNTIGRFGGDEFVVMLTSQHDQSDSVATVQSLLKAIAEPIQLDAQVLHVSGSAGITFFPQQEEVDADQLLRQADQAMFQAKLAGKNRCLVFDLEQHRSLRGQQVQLDRLQLALERREFILYYQPKVNMRTGTVLGAEALIRWQHPERGLLSPAVFFPLIEQHTLEIEVGRWVIDAALSQISRWHAIGLALPVSVNIAGFHLQHPEFLEELKALLLLYPTVPAHFLEFEVLESSTLGDIDYIGKLIRECQAIGVSTSLDDFGTGYSSLTYLKRLPASVLKIDQSFVRDMLHDPDDLAILEGVLGMARAFKLGVIAEGVETLPHGRQLLQLGCEQAQGYGIARPMPPDQMQEWVASWRPPPSWTQTDKIKSESLPLLYAIVEHRAWLRNAIREPSCQDTQPVEIEASRCHFGQWLATQKKANHSIDSQILAPIETVHQRIHDLTAELLDLRNKGHVSAAVVRIEDLQAHSAQLLTMLQELLDRS